MLLHFNSFLVKKIYIYTTISQTPFGKKIPRWESIIYTLHCIKCFVQYGFSLFKFVRRMLLLIVASIIKQQTFHFIRTVLFYCSAEILLNSSIVKVNRKKKLFQFRGKKHRYVYIRIYIYEKTGYYISKCIVLQTKTYFHFQNIIV